MTVDPQHLEQIRVLHAAVRKWLDDSAAAQMSAHLRANVPYVDLMFAFGFATLGDHATAKALVEDARKVLAGPVPKGGAPQDDQAVTAALVRNFMLKAFGYRIEQALGGKLLGGPLSAEVMGDRKNLGQRAHSAPVNNPYKLAAFVVDSFREVSRLVEPQEQRSPYAEWTAHADVLKRELAELHTVLDTDAWVDRIRTIHRDGVPGKPLGEVRVYLLHEVLPLAPRVGEAFAVELLGHVPAALHGTAPVTEPSDWSKKRAELLERALSLAGHFRRGDIVEKLVDEFTALTRSKTEANRYRLANVVARQCLRSLKKLGPVNELDRFLTLLHEEVVRGQTTPELKKKYSAEPELWSAALQTLLHLANGWLYLGLMDRARPILDAARSELLSPNAVALQPKDYTALAQAYVTALGQMPSSETGLRCTIELFRKMDPRKITNTWTTAQYFSRFHLNLVEDTVFVVCQQWTGEPVPAVVTA